jgi:hypothetical protein
VALVALVLGCSPELPFELVFHNGSNQQCERVVVRLRNPNRDYDLGTVAPNQEITLHNVQRASDHVIVQWQTAGGRDNEARTMIAPDLRRQLQDPHASTLVLTLRQDRTLDASVRQ